jgi:protein tyrosine phosphatase (PTP) superfamily phosphohydrolase (DUF442 family)
MKRTTGVTGLCLLAALAAGCQPGGGSAPSSRPAAEAPPADPAKVEAAGLHNVYRITDKLLSGSSPEGDEGFESLRRLGVRTVLSVDGARPDVERAHKYGLRYVHLPVGYDGVPPEQALRIAKAVRDLPGPVYVHCHHGKHRGPAAAAAAHLLLDEECSVATAVAEMQRAGTDPHYAGLYASPGRLTRPPPEELDRVPADFPEAAEVTALAQVMVGLDERWERLKQARAAGWKPPPDHPDIDPPHEALQLVEQYREAARLPRVQERGEEFRVWLADAAKDATTLEKALRTPGSAAAEQAYRNAGAACTHCHAKYRDVPQ